MAKAEIGWKKRDEEGQKVQVYAQHVGDRWLFYWRPGRFDQWEVLEKPPLEDWLELLNGIERAANRRRFPIKVAERVRRHILELFPEAEIPGWKR
jgi:hypothetical protein